LAVRAHDVCAADDQRRGASVVADGDPLVVGEQRGVRAKEAADAFGVMDGSVEVGVVADADGPVEDRSGDGAQEEFQQRPLRAIAAKREHEGAAEFGVAERHERVELGSAAGFFEFAGQVVDTALATGGVQVEDLFADADADVALAMIVFKDAVRQILKRESAAGDVGRGYPARPVPGFVEAHAPPPWKCFSRLCQHS
jgi:hypothetical protein